MQDDLVFIPQPRHRWNARSWIFALPVLVVLVPLVFMPGAWTFVVSLLDFDAFTGGGELSWPANYIGLFSGADPVFSRAVLSTLYLDAVFVPCTLVVSMVLAILLHRDPPGAKFFRAALFASSFVSVVAAGVAWRAMYHPTDGIVNGLLGLMGFDAIDFLRTPRLALPAIAVMHVWRWFPVCTIILMAGLKRIPSEAFDLAVTDGASRRDIIRHVTIPMLRRPVLICLVILIIVSLRSFEGVYVMTLDGGPDTWSLTLPFLLFHKSVEAFQIGPAAALAVMLAFITGLCVILLNAMGRSHFAVRGTDKTPGGKV